ncbi:MAG TPA: serine/threonine-protein kinase, partial [Fimbriiglobus sp.]|nr:serine/threonine-protein kinase [Fimbriiglobus sp.]
MSHPARPPAQPRTVRLRPDGRAADSGHHHPDTTNADFELHASVAAPAVRFVEGHPAKAPTTALGPEARDQFRRRLMLCCLIASVPFAFFTACAATNFIPLFGRDTVGWTGLVLSAVTLAGLGTTAAFLSRRRDLAEDALRVLEVSVFGVMAVFFAYWQFQVLTAIPPGNGHPEQPAVLAAAAIVHVNWLLLIVFHGVLVPNTLARGAGVAVAMCVVALTVSLIAAVSHPPTGRHAGSLFTLAATLLFSGAGLSIFGTAKTEALRREVETAREQVRQLGQYRLRKKLGHGGMGEVYLAEHQLLKRPCAVKRIHPRYLNNPEQVRRFEREVQATAQLRHPNTVEIYDYGRAEDGTFYYVMEYLPGMSLEDMVVRHGPLPAERVVHVLRQVCGALREAHKEGLVHRDIKPSNILVLPEGSPHDQAKLLDFGLVHSLYEEADPDSKITREGLIVGTPEYMSPEQASGGVLDGRSDLFSLGTVAYYLLTGREAFHRENPMKTLMAVVNEDPAPAAQDGAEVPEDVLAVVRRCLAKAPEERYQRAGELEIALLGCGCA